MTWPGKVAPWVIAVVASAIAVLAVVWALNRARGATRELARVNEAHLLELAGLNVAHQVERDALLNDLIGEAKASAALAEELARIQAAAPGAKPIAVAHGVDPVETLSGRRRPRARRPPPLRSSATAASPVPAPACPAVPARRRGRGPGDRASGAALETEPRQRTSSRRPRPSGAGRPGAARRRSCTSRRRSGSRSASRSGRPVRGGGSGRWWQGSEGQAVAGWLVGAVAATPSVRLLFGVEGSLVAGGGVGPGGVGGGFLSALLR